MYPSVGLGRCDESSSFTTDRHNSAQIMIVNALWDPATGYDQVLNLRHQLEGSVLLTRNGGGHGRLAWPATKQMMNMYLIDLKILDLEHPLVDHQETDIELMG